MDGIWQDSAASCRQALVSNHCKIFYSVKNERPVDVKDVRSENTSLIQAARPRPNFSFGANVNERKPACATSLHCVAFGSEAVGCCNKVF